MVIYRENPPEFETCVGRHFTNRRFQRSKKPRLTRTIGNEPRDGGNMHRILYGWGELSRALFVYLLQNMFEVMNYLDGTIWH